ncbi:MAG: hypothetical protein QF849_18425 [Pseudomonadales bacterium]|jgi:hypothetical protein|nr:hypothetical protein [Pseudomonadales bacterium]|tara:strand:- start:1479 stop:1931 length:453 start_codon:yes stop_codon:yes gene_type:complete
MSFATDRTTACFLGYLIFCAATFAVAQESGVFVAEAQLAMEIDDDNRAINPSNSFSTNTPQIFCAFTLTEGARGKTIEAVWIAEDVGAAAPPDYVIDTWSAALPPSSSLFQIEPGMTVLSIPDNGWPVGRYRVEFRFDGVTDRVLPFTIN